MPVKVYLGARFGRRAELTRYASALSAEGFEVTSRWLGHVEGDGIDHELTANAYAAESLGWAKHWSSQDVYDVQKADVVVLFTGKHNDAPLRGGIHVELGVALGAGKPVVVVGHRPTMFHHAANVVHRADSFEVAERFLNQWKRSFLVANPVRGSHPRDL